MERRARPERAVEGVLDAEQAIDRRRIGGTDVAVGPLPAVRPSLARVPMWKSTSVSGASDTSPLSHFLTMTRPCWLR